MLSTHRIKTLLAEVEKLKKQQQQHQSKSQVCALLTNLYAGFKRHAFNKHVVSADYVYIYNNTEKYRPDNSVIILLETESRYIQFSIKQTVAHSEINSRIWITMDKNIGPSVIDYEYAFDDTRFIEVYNRKCEKAKYGLTNFERYMIKLIVDGEMQDWDLDPLNIHATASGADDPSTCSSNAGLGHCVGDTNSSSQSDSEDQQPDLDMQELNNIGAIWE